jgi:hypothetical protein
MEILDSHVQMLHAIANRIIPADDAPGAGDNETMGYVAEVMTGDLGDKLGLLRTFLDTLNVAAKLKHRRAFTALIPAHQDSLLEQYHNDPAFHMLITLVNEGYWASDAGRAYVGFEVKG